VDRPKEPELSDVLAKLSRQAKAVENVFADLANVTDTAAEERRQHAQAAADDAVKQLEVTAKQMDKDISASKASAAADWRAMQTSIDEQIKAMQNDMAARKHSRDVKQAEEQAQAAKARAAWAASYAVAATEMARLAAIDADVARREAEARKR
jgi:hypothetical protein